MEDREIPNPAAIAGTALPPMPDPTPEQVNDPVFLAIWNVIKSWDVNVPEHYFGYCGATGSHVMLIFNALNSVQIDPDTAITAFMGWLTSRDEVSGPFSSRHSPEVELLKQFCEAQGWHASNERFHQQIKLLKERYPR